MFTIEFKTEYKCEFCEKIYTHRRSLWRHKVTAETCATKYKKEAAKTYTCEKCFKIYLRQDVYSRHFKSCKEQSSDYSKVLLEQLKDANNKILELKTEIKKLNRLNMLYINMLDKYESEDSEGSNNSE
jgi:hypothetical protein